MSLLENVHTQLTKTTEGSNKFYNIHLAAINKGDLFSGNEKTCSQNGFEVYSVFGKLEGSARKRHVGFFYSNEAAMRSCERLRESKRQKGYMMKNLLASSESKRIFMNAKSKKEKTKPMFEPLATVKPKMTTNQKNRYSDLID